MPDARWKKHERAVADLLGGLRLPNSGRGQPDVRASGMACQVKTTKALPAWLTGTVDQATRDAGEAELAVVVLNEVSRGRKARRLVVVDLGAQIEWRAGEDGTRPGGRGD